MFFLRNLIVSGPFLVFLALIFPALRSAVSIHERAIIGRFDNQAFSLPNELNDLADDDTVEVGEQKMTKGELKNMAKMARECHQFHTALVNDLQIVSLADKDVTNPVIIVGAHSSSMDRKQGNYKFLLDQICGAKGNAFFAEKIYPHVFNDLKLQSANSLGASVNLYLSGGSLDTPNESAARIDKLAKQHGAIVAANDDKFVMGPVMGSEAVGRTYLYEGFMTAKQKGVFEIMGMPPILLQAAPSLNKFNLGDKIVILVRITGSRRWQFSSGEIGHVFTGKLVKIVSE